MQTQAQQIIEDIQAQLEAARALRDYKIGTEREPRREGWLHDLLRIVEPWIGTGRPVPVGEIVCDARWGVQVITGPGGSRPPELRGRPGHTDTRLLADIGHWAAVDGLANLPEEEISPLIAACVASLTLTHGPLQLVLPDVTKPEDVLRVQKICLHKANTDASPLAALTGRKRKAGGWSVVEEPYRFTQGGHAMAHRWRDWLAELADAAGLPHPNHLSRLREWLHPRLLRRPDWLRDH